MTIRWRGTRERAKTKRKKKASARAARLGCLRLAVRLFEQFLCVRLIVFRRQLSLVAGHAHALLPVRQGRAAAERWPPAAWSGKSPEASAQSPGGGAAAFDAVALEAQRRQD